MSERLKVLNSGELVDAHLRHLDKARPLESYCTRTGACCVASIDVAGKRYSIPELPCKYLDKSVSGETRCTVYPERLEKAPWCRDLRRGLREGVYPESCVYARGLPGYEGKIEMPDEIRRALGPSIVGAIMAMPLDPFRPEDVVAFRRAFGEGDLGKALEAGGVGVGLVPEALEGELKRPQARKRRKKKAC